MSKSVKEKKYDNKTAKYVLGKPSVKKPDSIAIDPDKLNKEDDSKTLSGEAENAISVS